MDWRCGSSGRVPALQALRSEFKPQSQKGGKGREGKGKEGKEREGRWEGKEEGKGREGKGREGKSVPGRQTCED
jgi:hypothetical protein